MCVSRILVLILGGALAANVGCGGPGLPPAGPSPGDVDVGYGTRPSGKVTGAVSTVSEDEVNSARPLRIEELLRGRVPGLQISKGAGGRPSFRIRGTNSLLHDQEPLFVVDGIQLASGGVYAALAGLSVNDVRQIDVLKDIASTSIYGSRGAGGVILITTRH
jgi:TonB-dependent starch-binding outer membrane protein SusC